MKLVQETHWLGRELSQWCLNCLLRNNTAKTVLSARLGFDSSKVPANSHQTGYWFGFFGLALIGISALLVMLTSSSGSGLTWPLLYIIVLMLAAYGIAYYIYEKKQDWSSLAEWLMAAGAVAFTFGLFTVNRIANLHLPASALFLLGAVLTLLLILPSRSEACSYREPIPSLSQEGHSGKLARMNG